MLIKTLRRNQQLSQEQLAERTGLSLRTIQRVESGEKIGASSLLTLADFFAVSVDELQQSGPEMHEEIGNSLLQSLLNKSTLSIHRAIQLIIFQVTFFIFVTQWLAYIASFSNSSSDATLSTILGYISCIAVGAALITIVFGKAKIAFYRSYYFAALLLTVIAIAINYWLDTYHSASSTNLVFPVYWTFMFLVLAVFHVLQLALSLQSESFSIVHQK